MINVEDVPSAIRELERTRKAGLAGAMITRDNAACLYAFDIG